jgi:hypothetical protein
MEQVVEFSFVDGGEMVLLCAGKELIESRLSGWS